jgi:hypothetical protein
LLTELALLVALRGSRYDEAHPWMQKAIQPMPATGNFASTMPRCWGG